MSGTVRRAVRRERLVVVGNGMASLRLLDELTALAPDRFEITCIGAEPVPAYNRVLLSSLLAGEIAEVDVEMKPRAWYEARGVRLLTGISVTGLRPNRREAVTSTGERITYDSLVLATGSVPLRLPIPGAGRGGVMTFRDLGDTAVMGRAAAGTRAIVIGGGLLGIEAAFGLSRRGCQVTLVHLMPRLMERQLDEPAAALLKSAVEARGITVLVSASTTSIDGGASVESVTLADGRRLPASLVVMAAGVKPWTSLAETSGIEIGRGIKVDDKLETNWPRIHAIGECAEHRGVCYGLVEPAYEQAKALARYLGGQPSRYAGSLLATNLKVAGIGVVSMGEIEGADAIVVHDRADGVYRKFVMRDGRLAGAVLVGDTTDALWYRDLLREGRRVDDLRAMLAFGRSYAEAA